jgi:hypothetical protein
MASFRTFATAVAAAAFLAAGSSFALADPPPWAHGHGHHGRREVETAAPAAAGAHGVISGTIAGVDYGGASILISTPRGMVPVAVTPTTSIFRGSAFASLSDLARGSRVSIDFSQIGGRLVAQIIRIH